MFPMMGKAELKKLSQSKLVSIQPHTVHHPRLTKISDNEIFVELVQSKNYLEKLLNVECYHFAYPYGMQDKRVQKVVHKTGIKYAYTTKEGFIKSTDEPLSLNRNSMNRTISLKQFEFICLFGKPTLRRLTRSDANYR
jgi:peptidoglycan/xylan/chitin deacetylase (PgdA/CDA1 family)